MVKLLSDVCLGVIQDSLDKIPNVGSYLPTVFKEKLIERLASHDQLTPSYLPVISYNLFTKSLRQLKLYKCSQVNDHMLQLLASSGCKLEVIIIVGCVNVTDTGIQALTTHQKELVSVKFRKLKCLTGRGLDQISSSCLEHVDLRHCHSVSFEGVSRLVQRNPTVKTLRIAGIEERACENGFSSKIQEVYQQKCQEIVDIAATLRGSLEELDTELNQLNDECLCALAKYCPNLKRLNLHGSSRISGDALIKFSMGCTSLQMLDLSYCSNFAKLPGSEALWILPASLSELSLCGILLEDETIFVECLQRLKNLKVVRLCGVTALNDDTLTQILSHIGENLTFLDLCGGVMGKLTDEGLESIPKYCMNLEHLALSLLSEITGFTLIPLFKDTSRAMKFRKLNLSFRRLDQDFLHVVVTSCHNLEMLDVSGLTFITDDILLLIAENCRSLTEIGLKGCRQVTDYGVRELVRCCNFKSMVLAGIHNLTDSSIFALANTCHYLEEIYLNGCAQVSPTAVRYLTDCCIPRLFVKHATPNARPNQLMARNLDTGEFCPVDLMQYRSSAGRC